jgi:hypothetical protein
MSDSRDKNLEPGHKVSIITTKIWINLLLVMFIPPIICYLLKQSMLIENYIFVLIALFASFTHAVRTNELVRSIVARKLGMEDAWTDMKFQFKPPVPLKKYYMYIKYRSNRKPPTKKEVRMILIIPLFVSLICTALFLWLLWYYNLSCAFLLFFGHLAVFMHNVGFLFLDFHEK